MKGVLRTLCLSSCYTSATLLFLLCLAVRSDQLAPFLPACFQPRWLSPASFALDQLRKASAEMDDEATDAMPMPQQRWGDQLAYISDAEESASVRAWLRSHAGPGSSVTILQLALAFLDDLGKASFGQSGLDAGFHIPTAAWRTLAELACVIAATLRARGFVVPCSKSSHDWVDEASPSAIRTLQPPPFPAHAAVNLLCAERLFDHLARCPSRTSCAVLRGAHILNSAA